MSKRKMMIRDSVTPDPIDFYMEIKKRKNKNTVSEWMSRQITAYELKGKVGMEYQTIEGVIYHE